MRTIDTFLFVGGYGIFFLIVLISLTHLRLQLRIANDNISRSAIQSFLDGLRFPITLVYGGPIGNFMDLDTSSKLLRRSATRKKPKPTNEGNWAIFAMVALLTIFIVGPLLLCLNIAVYSENATNQAIAFLTPILTTAIIRPWRFGEKLRDIEAELNPTHAR
jgi:hypothetical protein